MKTIQELFTKFTFTIALLTGLSSNLQAQRIVRAVPRNNTVVVYSGVSYRYANGYYYKPHRSGYVVVTPPVGLRVRVLPVGYTNVVIGGRTYFYFGGVYYIQEQPNSYKIVEIPKEAYLIALPAGVETITINGKRYYKIDNTYYEKLVSENGTERYVLVGEKMQ
ncbi:hypothetical protein SAMN05421825_2501 [Epilithonimonas hungarica]|uniref:Uncharacterized protein n=1 Tax=Epilithonimonas hungarica TaxID=454006 RepID=A0A1G7R168_9FLAO|nr:hypothetical protein SAMN05421825_2501 [Epilithonimonas hungarica]